MLAMQLRLAPIVLIGASALQVYLVGAPQKYYKGELKLFTNKTIIMLCKLGFIPLLIAEIAAPISVPIIFGKNWNPDLMDSTIVFYAVNYYTRWVTEVYATSGFLLYFIW